MCVFAAPAPEAASCAAGRTWLAYNWRQVNLDDPSRWIDCTSIVGFQLDKSKCSTLASYSTNQTQVPTLIGDCCHARFGLFPLDAVRIQFFSQGHFTMWTVGAGIWTAKPLVVSWPFFSTSWATAQGFQCIRTFQPVMKLVRVIILGLQDIVVDWCVMRQRRLRLVTSTLSAFIKCVT